MRVALGADHGGYALKKIVQEELLALGHVVVDCGADTFNPTDDYPDFAEAVGIAVQQGQAERGIVICGSGVGAAVAASKMRGIRSSVCHDTYSAHQGVEHDDMNVLALGARIIGDELAKELVRAYLSAQFSGAERHQRRLDKVLKIEKEQAVPYGK